MELAEANEDNNSPRMGSVSRLIKRKKDRKAKDDKSTSSAGNSDLSVNVPEIRRVSTDGPIDRLRERVRSVDAGSQNNDGLGKRLSNKMSGRRRKSIQPNSVQSSPGTRLLGVSPRLDAADKSNRFGQTRSETSLGRAESISSDLLTEDDDVSQQNTRPSLVTRDSHAGYLTLSSPLISTETVDPAPTKTQSLVAVQPVEGEVDSKTGETLKAPQSDKRSASPVGRLKEALSISRKTSSQSLKEEDKKTANKGKSGQANGAEVTSATEAQQDSGSTSQSSSDVQEVNAAAHKANSRQKTPQTIITVEPPQTPPSRSDTIITLVTPPTPTTLTSGSLIPQTTPKGTSKGSPVASLSTRRLRTNSNPPSKLSNPIPSTLTPTIEESKTPGGTLTAPSTGGFFASVFSATQNAANQFTSSIANPSFFSGAQRSRSGTGPEHVDKTGPAGGEEVITPDGVAQSTESLDKVVSPEKRPLAVETLGSGNLSLSHLGISEAPLEPAKPSMAVDRNGDAALAPTAEVMAHADDDAAARAVSAAYLDKPNGDKGTISDADKSSRPRSIGAQSDIDTQTPTRAASVADESSILRRTGSIRSKVSAGRKRRHRGSSATTGNTIAAAISSTNAAFANPATGQKLTGFAVANPKRNRDFHQLFRSVPEDDYLIEDYSAALQRDILLQGRLYISEGHVCFSSNILGWVTNLVISFDEVVSVEKKSTAVIFPNAIVIQALHARNVFASFVTRDTTYDLLINIWKISHPNLKSSLNGVALDDSGGTGDKTEKTASVRGDEGSDESTDDSDDDVYDEDAEEDDATGSFVDTTNGDAADGVPTADDDKVVSRKVSAAAVGATIAGGAAKVVDAIETAALGTVQGSDFPGPSTHEPTECGDVNTHYEKPLMDTTIPAPLGKIYNMLFGPGSGLFMRKFLVDDQKSLDLQLDDKAFLDENKKSMNFSYIKPLGGSIGPKQTKCIISQTLEQLDLDKAVTVNCSTQNPDVPSGNIFVVKTKYCLMWGPGNSTRLIMTCAIEWSGKSWLKGPIEKGTNDGQNAYAKDLVAALRSAVVAKAAPKPSAKGPKGAKKRSKRESDGGVDQDTLAATAPLPEKKQTSNWGPLEPLRTPLEPLVDVLGNTRTLLGFLTIMVLYLWWAQSSTNFGLGHRTSSTRMVAYEEMWRQEESELWRWLDSRVGGANAVADALLNKNHPSPRVRKTKGNTKDEMSQREVEEAIRLTREKLEVLEGIVKRSKEGSGSSP